METVDFRAYLTAPVITAGAYVLINGGLLFVIGPTPTGQRLAIVRLGGHCEAGETAWQCAAREVAEEASLVIRPCRPPATYWLDRERTSGQIQLLQRHQRKEHQAVGLYDFGPLRRHRRVDRQFERQERRRQQRRSWV